MVSDKKILSHNCIRILAAWTIANTTSESRLLQTTGRFAHRTLRPVSPFPVSRLECGWNSADGVMARVMALEPSTILASWTPSFAWSTTAAIAGSSKPPGNWYGTVQLYQYA